MTPETVLTIMQQTLEVIGILIAAILLPALTVGLLVSMFQAATSINEQTLTFIPKILDSGADACRSLDADPADQLLPPGI